MAFKVGDKIVPNAARLADSMLNGGSSFCIGWEGVMRGSNLVPAYMEITELSDMYTTTYDAAGKEIGDNCMGCFNEENAELYNPSKGGAMSDQVNIQDIKNLKLSADDLLLLDQGIIDNNGNLTSQGQVSLWQYIFAAHKDEIVKDIRMVIANRKAETKETKK